MLATTLILAASIAAAPVEVRGACADPRRAIEMALPVIESFEGLRLRAYKDPRPGAPIWTIGVGHIQGVRQGDTITIEHARELERQDATEAAGQICGVLEVAVDDEQLAGLISFVFNLGIGTLLKSAHQGLLYLINQGRFASAARVMRRYVYAGKPPQVLPGLVRRREAEARMLVGS